MGDSLADNVQRRAGPAAIIVGAGLMGRHHAQAAAAADASIVAIVDQNKAAAIALAASWPGALAETDLQKAADSSGPTVAHVCTPAGTHAAIAEMIAEAGLHAMIEKPLGRTAGEAKEIHHGFALRRKLVCPTHQYAFQRSVREAAGWLPRAGALRRISFDICSAGATDRLDPDEIVAEILPHPLSMVQTLVPSMQITTLDWHIIRAAAGEWVISAPVEGAVLVIQVSLNGRPTRFMTRIAADGGSMELDNFHDFAVTLPGTVSRGAKIVQPFLRSGFGLAAAGMNLAARAVRREFAYPGLRTLAGEFYRAVQGEGPPPITPEQSIAVAEARDRIIALAGHG